MHLLGTLHITIKLHLAVFLYLSVTLLPRLNGKHLHIIYSDYKTMRQKFYKLGLPEGLALS